MRILISGAGIAGPTLAYWLAHFGFEPTIIERAPHLRTGGYVIDFWGVGYDIAERMGLIPELLQIGYRAQEVRIVNRENKTVAGFPVASLNRATQGRYISLSRGDLAACIFEKVRDRVDTIFGDSITGIEQSEKSVRVSFERESPRDFDLVIGADGLHSRVRELVFGEEPQFEKYLGYKVAAFGIPGYRPRDESVYVMYTEVRQQVARFAMHNDRTMFLFSFADQNATGAHDLNSQKLLLRQKFGSSGWECPQILEAMENVTELYFDRVSQIQMNSQWSRGRVTLIGDAAFCVSLLAGQGSALAVAAAYVLAGELCRAGGNYEAAFRKYEELFGPFAAMKQKAALGFAGLFGPKSKMALFVRNQVMNLMKLPWLAELAMGRGLADKIVIPEY
jgi:2-polyprenyl-6-methoxyphenol hydroxylase-like FAD-dependent oxidoreductase